MMQLAKNLFLSRKKTFARKIEEAVLTHYLASAFTREEILELYLNIVEFGPDLYGVRAAAGHYFGKGPAQLSLAESFALAALLPAPTKFSFIKSQGLPPLWKTSIKLLIDGAAQRGLVTPAEAERAKSESLIN
jgi:membrane peptidoglycan carboxypeptidase